MNTDAGWSYVSRTSDGDTTVRLSGEIDMTGSGRLQEMLQEAVRSSRVVTVDLAAVGFIDSTVIGALIRARNAAEAAGCRLTVVNAAAQVRRVLQMTGVLDALTA
jgi:anti-anti-sigma factor